MCVSKEILLEIAYPKYQHKTIFTSVVVDSIIRDCILSKNHTTRCNFTKSHYTLTNSHFVSQNTVF